MTHPISKTDFILYRECPKNAWMKIHKLEIYYRAELSEFEKHIIETGNQVELVARELFPTGILIEGRDELAQEKTRECISNKQSTLFQPVFAHDGFLAAVDILKYDPETGGWNIYEVKASNEVNEKVHFYDLAFQVILLRKCGVTISGIHLIHLNKDYIRSGELDLFQLFSIDNVGDEIEATIDEVSGEMNKAKEYLTQPDEPKGFCCCIYKGRSQHCSTFTYSNPEVPAYSIHDIARIGSSKKKLVEMVNSNAFDLNDTPDHIELSDIQKNQVDAHRTGKAIIHAGKIKEALETLQYPLYFLDYETFPSAIPQFDGFSPYQQIPFQYSLHVLDTPDGELNHYDFLHTGADNPCHAFYKSLESNIGTSGSVVVWNKKFECMINRELGERLPESAGLMEAINARVFDLMEIFSKQLYVDPGFKGSFSIKKVLPVLAPELSYEDLAIGDGGLAAKSWSVMVSPETVPNEASTIAKNLKEYCKLDTYAMYAIWKNLQNL